MKLLMEDERVDVGRTRGRRLIQTCVEDHGVLPASRQQLEVSEKSFSRQLHVEVGQRQSGRPQHGSVRGVCRTHGPVLLVSTCPERQVTLTHFFFSGREA